MSMSDAIAGDGSIGDEALTLFREAMSTAPINVIAPPSQPEQLVLLAGAKRSSVVAGLPRLQVRSTKNKPVAPSASGLLNVSDHSAVLSNLSKQVFPCDREAYDKLGCAAILEKSQTHLMEVISVCHHVETELEGLKEEISRLNEADHILRREKEAETSHCDSILAAKEIENEALRSQSDDLTSQLSAMTTSTHQLLHEFNVNKTMLLAAGPVATIRCR